MNCFRNRKTATKLMMGFGLMGVLIAIVGYYEISRMHRIAANLYRHSAGSSHLRESEAELIGATESGYDILVDAAFKDLASVEKRIADSKKYDAAFEKAFEEFKSLISRDELRIQAAEISKLYQETKTKKEQLLSLAKKNKPVEAYASMKAVLSLSDNIEKRMAKLVEDQTANRQKAFEDANATAVKARNFLIGMISAAILCGLALAFIIARMTTRPVGDVTGVLRATAAGDLTRKLNLDTKDEVGQIAKALNETVKGVHGALVGKVISAIGSKAKETIH